MTTETFELRWYFACMEDGHLYAFSNAVERDYWVDVSKLQPLTNHQTTISIQGRSACRRQRGMAR